MGKIITSDDFLKKAEDIWKDEYDYSNVVFIDEDIEVIIIWIFITKNILS